MLRNSGTGVLSLQDAKPYYALVYLGILGAVAASLLGFKGVVFLLVGIAALAIGWHPTTLPVLFLYYIVLFPGRHFGTRFEVLPFYFVPSTIMPAIALMLFLMAVNSYRVNSLELRKQHLPDILAPLVIAFVGWHIAQCLRGAGYGYQSFSILGESNSIAIFLAYFVWRFIVRTSKTPTWWIHFLAITGLIGGLEYIYLVITSFTNVFDLVILRPITNQGHITLVSVPLITGLVFASKRKLTKALYSLSFVIVTAHVLVTQKRVLWVIYLFSLFIFFTLYFFRNGFTFKRALAWLTLLLVAIGLATGLLYLSSYILGVDLDLVLMRWNGLESMNDGSIKVRFADAARVMSRFDNQWLVGKGAGSRIHLYSTGLLYRFMDNSYISALYKGGLPWLFMLLAIYGVGIYRSYILYQKSNIATEKLIGAAMVASFLSILLAGLTENSTIYFAQTYIWMFLLAITTVYYERFRIRERNSKN